jgi:hypothetical protein
MTTIFRNAQINKETLREIILKNPHALLNGLSFIDLQLTTDESGIIDFLGVDTNGRMVLVDFDVKPNDQMLIEILAQIQWLKKNQGLIKRLFFSESVDFEQTPQILLICPEFSSKIQSAVKQLREKDIKLLNFKYIVSDNDDAIIFDEIFSNVNSNSALLAKLKAAKAPEPAAIERPAFTKPAQSMGITVPELNENTASEQAPLYDVITLTPEEIAEFIDFDVALEQNQTAD